MNIRFLFISLFLTITANAQVYLDENFNASIPATWTITDAGSATGDSWFSGSAGTNITIDGTNAAVVDSDAAGSGGIHLIETLTSPIFDSSSAVNLIFTFDQFYRHLGSQSGTVQVFDGTSWVTLLTLTATIGGNLTPDQVTLDLTAYKNANTQIRFLFDDAAGYNWYWLIDNLKIENILCYDPENIITSNLTSTSVDISWDDNTNVQEWYIVVQDQGIGNPSNPTAIVTTNNYSLNNLTPNTNYEIYLQADCGGSNGFSNWVGPVNFTSFNIEPATAPTLNCTFGNGVSLYEESFELNVAPPNWTGIIVPYNASNDGNWQIVEPGVANNFSGPDVSPEGTTTGAHMEFEGGNGIAGPAISRLENIDISNAIEGLNLEFDLHAYGDQTGTLIVRASNDNVTFTEVFNYSGQYQQNATQDWFRAGADLSAYLGSTLSLEFEYTATGFRNELAIDNVEIISCASACNAPIDVFVSNATGVQANVTWTAQSGENLWEYVVVPAGTGTPNGTPIQTASNSIVVGPLDPNTDYEVYVRAICNTTTTSNWAGPTLVQNVLVSNTSGSAVDQGDGCYLITPAQNSQVGTVWYENQIDLTQNFKLIFDTNFGADDSGADGMAFVLKTTPDIEVGLAGQGLGYGGINNSLIVEFDTFDNGFNGDGIQDHIAIMSNGEFNHNNAGNLAGPVNALEIGGVPQNIEDNVTHEVKIEWDAATQTLSVFFDCDNRLTYTGDIVTDIFSSNSTVYFGFTGSTGGFNNLQQLCFKYIQLPIPVNLLIDKQICSGDTVTDVDANYDGATSYMWSPATGVSDPTIANPTFSPTTTTTYTLDIEACGENLDAQEFTIYVSQPEIAGFTYVPSCDGAIATLDSNATLNGSFNFNPTPTDGAILNSNTGEITNGVSGTNYTVEYTTPGTSICTGVDVASVTVTISPQVLLQPATTITECDLDEDGFEDFNITTFESDILNGLSNVTVTYFTSLLDAENNVVANAITNPTTYNAPDGTTIYMRVENNTTGCFAVTQFDLVTADSTALVFVSNITEVPADGTPITLEVDPTNYNPSTDTIEWYLDNVLISGETNLTISVSEEGVYEMVFININGCTSRISQDITKEISNIIPQGISPNNDGLNDTFNLKGLEVQSIEIFNRYGTQVYTKGDGYTNEWFGQDMSGNNLPTGTYYYTLRFSDGKQKASWVYINR